MSGTSLDGVDVVVTDFAEFPPRLLYCSTTPYSTPLQDRLRRLCRSQTTSLDELYSLDAELGEVYAKVVDTALQQAGITRQQVKTYMSSRTEGRGQAQSSARADISERSGRRIERVRVVK